MLRRKYQEKETANIIAFDMDVRMQKSNGGYFMNNEINRRDFMKLSVASIMTASVTLNLGNTYTEILHYYYDNSSYNNPSVGIVKIN